MITRSQFTRIADEHGVDAKTVERDYVLTHAVTVISQRSAEHGLVFKGGTALRLCYFEDYRYSADLDFSLRDGGDLTRTGDWARLGHLVRSTPHCAKTAQSLRSVA